MHWETRLTNDRIREHAAAWRGPRLGDAVHRHARRDPARMAVVDARQRLTYGELDERADRLAMGLLDLGLRPRDAVSVQLPNRVEFVVLALALERIGAVINPISTIMRERELEQMLTVARARAFVVVDAFRGFEHAQAGVALKASCPDLEHVIVLGDVPGGATDWHDLDAVDADARLLAAIAPDLDDVLLLSFTSGTTGEPKGVMHTSNTMGAIVGSTIRRQGFSSETSVLMAAPLGHAIGYYWGVRMPLTVGGCAAYQPAWDPDEALDIMERERTTFTMGTPAFLRDLLDSQEARPRDISALALVICGGASIPPALMRTAMERLQCRVFPTWGMTENGICTTCDASTPFEKLLSTDGRPQPEVEVRIVGGDGGLAGPGEEGRLLVRGPFNFVGYSQGREFTAGYFPDGDWFETGDLAYLDSDGYLRITGRTKDLVIRGGENIPVKEVEDALSDHPAIRDVAVVAIPDDRLGERACACVSCYPGAAVDLAEIQRHLAEHRLAKPYWPEEVRLYDELPRTPSGKVQKFALRQDLAAP